MLSTPTLIGELCSICLFKRIGQYYITHGTISGGHQVTHVHVTKAFLGHINLPYPYTLTGCISFHGTHVNAFCVC